MRINWREIFKFLSGAALLGSLTNAYLYFNDISVPFLGYTLTPEQLEVRSLVNFALFWLFLYYGYLKK